MNESNVTNYAGFDTVRSVYSITAVSSFCLGILLNLLLSWLILTKTDVLIVTVSTVVQPIPIVDHGYRALFQNGFFRNLPQPYAYMMNVLWIQLLLFFLASTTAQFIFRYFLLSKDGHIPHNLIWFMGVMAFFLNLFHIILLAWADYPRPDYFEKMEELSKLVTQEAGITDVKFSSFTWARSFPWLMHCAIMVFLFSTCYAVITVMGQHFIYLFNRFAYSKFVPSCANLSRSTWILEKKIIQWKN